MKQWAVCYVTQNSLVGKWTLTEAENAREAAKRVRERIPMCHICGIFKRVGDWKWLEEEEP